MARTKNKRSSRRSGASRQYLITYTKTGKVTAKRLKVKRK